MNNQHGIGCVALAGGFLPSLNLVGDRHMAAWDAMPALSHCIYKTQSCIDFELISVLVAGRFVGSRPTRVGTFHGQHQDGYFVHEFCWRNRRRLEHNRGTERVLYQPVQDDAGWCSRGHFWWSLILICTVNIITIFFQTAAVFYFKQGLDVCPGLNDQPLVTFYKR